MAEVRALRNPPLVEVLLDVQFLPLETGQPIESFEEIARAMGGPESDIQRLESIEASVKHTPGAGPPSVASLPPQLTGFVAFNKEANRIFSVGNDKLTVGQRAPYAGWDAIFATLRNAFDLYIAKSDQPRIVSRISARFVNQIAGPGGRWNTDDYLEWSFGMPSSPQWPTVEFNHRTVLHNEEENLYARIVLRDHRDPRAGKVDVIIDIDVVSLDRLEGNFDAIGKVFDRVRKFKNEIFFGMVKEKALEMYS